MACLRIQVLGRGLIPRGYGIAPRKEPFNADLSLIQTILNTPGLKVRMMHPETGQFMNVTSQTLKRLWDKYSGMEVLSATSRMQKRREAEKSYLNPSAPAEEPVPTPPPPKPNISPAASAMVKEAVNEAVSEVFGKNDPPAPVEQPKEEEQKTTGTVVKPYNPEDHKKHDKKK